MTPDQFLEALRLSFPDADVHVSRQWYALKKCAMISVILDYGDQAPVTAEETLSEKVVAAYRGPVEGAQLELMTPIYRRLLKRLKKKVEGLE
jgi:hypothetical protein